MKKIGIIFLLTSLSIFGQHDSIFSISGKLKLAIENKIFSANDTFIELYPSSYGAITYSLGNFRFDAVKSGRYELRMLEYERVSNSFRLEVNNKSVKNIDLVIRVNCNLNSEVAKSDIERGEPKLLLIGGIAPVYHEEQEEIEKKYGFKYFDFGCDLQPRQCVLLYNGYIFNYLDGKFGDIWRQDVRQDIIGLSE